jgi:hypothetical protein
VSPLELAHANLTSPIVLAFVLGAVATLVRSDLRIPEAVTTTLSIYLLLAIGLKGGVELSEASLGDLWLPALVTLGLGIVTPIVAFGVLRRGLRLGVPDAAALAAHYGSVSAVTFTASLAFLAAVGVDHEGFVTTLLALLEVPAIVVALLIARMHSADGGSVGEATREILAGKSVLLLVGGLVIGLAAGKERFAPVEPVFVDAFKGALVLFLLDLGMTAARRLRDVRGIGVRLVGFAIAMPIVNGAAGVTLGTLAGLSLGGATVLGVMAASASYIAAPAAVRIALPDANPSLYLTASIGITFPFNLAIGIPLYHQLAKLVQ